MAQLNNLTVAYDTGGHPIIVFPQPTYLTRAPGVNDQAEEGSVVINTTTNLAYMCTDNALGAAVWLEITQGGGGPGIFTTLTAQGETNLNVATANDFNLLTGASSGDTHINDGTGTGTVAIGNAASGATTVLSGAAATFGSSLSAANAVVIDASGANGGLVIKAGATNGITIAPDADTDVIDIANVVPTANRTVVVANAALVTGAPISDSLTIGAGGMTASAATDQLARTVNIATGDTVAITDAAATSDLAVNIATGDVLDDGTGTATATIELGSGDCTAGTHTVNIGTGLGGGTKRVDIGNVDSLTATSIFGGPLNLNTGASIGGIALGGATVPTIQIGDVAPTVARTTTISGGLLATAAIADTVDIAVDGVNDGGAGTASRVVNIMTGAATSGTQTVNVGSTTTTVNVDTGLFKITETTDSVAAGGGGENLVAASTLHVYAGKVTITGCLAANGSDLIFTLTNDKIAIASSILASVSISGGVGGGAEDARMVVEKIVPAAGSAVFTITNLGAAAVNSDLNVGFLVLA